MTSLLGQTQDRTINIAHTSNSKSHICCLPFCFVVSYNHTTQHSQKRRYLISCFRGTAVPRSPHLFRFGLGLRKCGQHLSSTTNEIASFPSLSLWNFVDWLWLFIVLFMPICLFTSSWASTVLYEHLFYMLQALNLQLEWTWKTWNGIRLMDYT